MRRLFKIFLLVSNLSAIHLLSKTDDVDARIKRYKSPFFKAEWEYQIETVVKREACLLLGKKFGRNFATMSFGSPFAKSDLLEVVGNIYENPELLEVGQ